MSRQAAAILLVAGFVAALLACRKDPSLTQEDPCASARTPLHLDYHAFFPDPVIPADNPLTVEGVELGRRLYYDPILSSSGPLAGRSCSSCHFQEHAFTVPDPGVPAIGNTNVLSHCNLAWASHFLWDGSAGPTLEDVMRYEVEDFFQLDVNVLREHPEYPELFRKAFGTCEITLPLVEKAMAQWFRRLTSANSKFDRFLKNEEALSPEEWRGFQLFFTEAGDCFHCHSMPLMTDDGFHNIGLDSIFVGKGVGRYAVTGNPMDMGAFKTPTLRNIALTAPYMHDGRFQTLEEVVDFYSGGAKHSPSLDPIMTKPGTGITIGMTPEQKADLVAFLHTLTDDVFVTDTALASPF
ncbi:MAG TPA: cytochrome c peroxidase [Flavobacteriales bacterium]|nr:cytochrome c peroxidase [Flavobacteriales bacterium]